MTNPLVRLEKLSKSFGKPGKSILAMNQVSLSILPGTTYGLVGESGCGKSTLALSLARLQSIDSGNIFFDGQDITHLSGSPMRDLRKNIRLLFQNPESVLNTGMTIYQILQEETQKLDGSIDKDKLIKETLEKVELTERHMVRYPSSLSTGEKQRAAIARAIITLPKFLICDEPVASLDLSLKEGVVHLLKDLQDKLSITYLYISHNLGVVAQVAHTIGIMYMGNLVEESPVEYFSPEKLLHPYSRLLLASVPSTRSEQFSVILNQYPDVEPMRLKSGCPFRNRCPLYRNNPLKECEEKNPELKSYTSKRKVACFQVEGTEISL